MSALKWTAALASAFSAGVCVAMAFSGSGVPPPPPPLPAAGQALQLGPAAHSTLETLRQQISSLSAQNILLLAKLTGATGVPAPVPVAAAAPPVQPAVLPAVLPAVRAVPVPKPLPAPSPPRRSSRVGRVRPQTSDIRWTRVVDSPSAWLFSPDDSSCDGVEELWDKSPAPPLPPQSPSTRPTVLVLMFMCWDSARNGKCDPSGGDLARLIPDGMGDPSTVPPPNPRCSSTASSAGARRLLVNSQLKPPNFISRSVLNKVAYARRHGYGVKLATGPHPGGDRLPTHGMTEAVLAELKRWDWVWYLDLDTIITRFDMPVLSIANSAPPERDIFITRNWHGINTGSILVRGKSAAAVRFFELSTKLAAPAAAHLFPVHSFLLPGNVPPHTPPAFNPWSNQLAYMKALTCVRALDPKVEYVAARKMNAYPGHTWMPQNQRDRYEWQNGDLLIHFAGCGDIVSRDCERDFAQYAAAGEAGCK
eukprot:TRINITY_DN3254_c0_g6_i1.p1 TRINITY_DN3254_c0_g6~~TRINITY_DN3254_c0_g6_i1.p1  ORF type:complete len:492 (+),score=106.34 TRINITY_DN3254_c0_g6_i1:44-1477(+)